MKRTMLMVGCMLLLGWAASIAVPPDVVEVRPGQYKSMGPADIDYQTYIDANRLLMFVTNVGSFANDKTEIFGRAEGLYFPSGSDLTLMYAAGLWLGGKVGDDLRVSVAEYSHTYAPGPMIGGTFQPDNPAFKVYKIVRQLRDDGFYDGPRPMGDPMREKLWDDYHQWTAAMGAPVDSQGKPKFIGDQTLWSVFNDADPAAHTNRAGSALGLGVEAQTTAFAFNRTWFSDVIVMRYVLINKGMNDLRDMYVGFWADPDVGGGGDDYAACDTTINLGYAYNADNEDEKYGPNPPAVGFTLLSGPAVPSPTDSAFVLGGWRRGFRKLPMTAFTRCINGLDPTTPQESYSYMRGRDQSGGTMINPLTGQPTTFMFSGDPVAGTGWVDDAMRVIQHLNIDILEVAGPGGVPVNPPEDVANSWNSTNEWYVTSDHGDDFNRLNWQGLIGTDTWEFRFTAAGSEYYDWNSEKKWPDRVPFEVWNLGPEKPNEMINDRRIQIAILDDNASGGWTPGDRIYPFERTYPAEPLPQIMDYTYPNDFHIGRIKFNGAVPQQGTKVRFVSHGMSGADTLWGQDCRFMAASGPFNMARGDTQEVVMAVVAGRGADRLSSVSILKTVAELVSTSLTPDDDVCLCLKTGDLNDNGIAYEIADLVTLINYAVRGGAAPPSDPDCPLINRADFNCDGRINMIDVVRTAYFIFGRTTQGPCNPCRRW